MERRPFKSWPILPSWKHTKGKHLDKPRQKIVYRQAKEIKMVSPQEFDVCVDGEMIKGNNFVVEVCPKAIKLVPPAKAE